MLFWNVCFKAQRRIYLMCIWDISHRNCFRLTFGKKVNCFFKDSRTYLITWDKWQALHPSCPPHLPPLSPSFQCAPHPPILPAALQSNRGARQDPATHETSDTGQQVNLLAPYLSDPSIHLAILYIFHLWCIFFFFYHHPTIHPSILAFPPSFSLACYNGLLRVDWRIYVHLYLWRREQNKGERDWKKHRRAVSIRKM